MKANEIGIIKSLEENTEPLTFIVENRGDHSVTVQMQYYYHRNNVFFFRGEASEKLRIEVTSDCAENMKRHMKVNNYYLVKCTPKNAGEELEVNL